MQSKCVMFYTLQHMLDEITSSCFLLNVPQLIDHCVNHQNKVLHVHAGATLLAR